MQTKTYFASSVPAALEVARKELGDDAMLVTSKPAAAAARAYGRLEVTFAYEPKPVLAPEPKPAASRVVTPAFEPEGYESKAYENKAQEPRSSKGRNLASEMEEIRQQIASLKQAVVTQGVRPGVRLAEPRGAEARAPETHSPAVELLRENGVSREMAEEVALAARRSDAPDALARELASRLQVAQFAEPKPGETRAMALVGPPGRGKTTTLVKIAVRYGLANRVPVKIYLAGSHGVGCEDQLARYAAVLGVPFQACESLEGLGLALNGDMWKGLALIDTPGISLSDSVEIGDFARFFKRRPEIERHLVLRADAGSADLSHVIGRFAAMEVSRLLFTGLDEAVSLGAMADAMMRTRIPAALAGTGQGIPDDLETVSAAQVARAVCADNAYLDAVPYRENASAAIAA
jgi:flagellar biosynthesis protein FlhF